MNPGDEYSAVPFWFFNDAPDPGKIREELADMKDKGISAFVLHPRIGIPKDIPYLTDKFFDAVRFIVKTADELGMRICLYDEGMYPSGSAHGAVVAENPDWAARGLCLADRPADTRRTDGRRPDETIALLPDGKCLLYTFTGGTIRGIHFGEDDGENPPPAADLLNPDAVAAFIRLTHDRYYKELKPYFGNTVFAFFTDEPSPVGRGAENFRPWAEGLGREIQAGGGNLADLAGLFTGEENATTRLYKRLIKRRLRETFYRPISEWCENHGIALMGHPAESDDVEEEFYFQYPGQDLIQRRIRPKEGALDGMDSVQAKLAADIARALGRKRNINECFGVCFRNGWPWYMTAEDIKWYTDWLGARGCSLFCPHAFFYSVRDGADGKRSGERPPDVGPNNIWWPHYRIFAAYFRRLSWLNTGNTSGARIAVLAGNNEVPCDEVRALYRGQIGFNYLPVQLPDRARMENGRLIIGSQTYDALFDPFDLLHKEAEDVKLSPLPVYTRAQDVLDASKRQPLWRAVMTETEQPDLRAVLLYKEGQKCILLSNEGKETIRTGLKLPAESGETSVAAADLFSGEVWNLPADRCLYSSEDDPAAHVGPDAPEAIPGLSCHVVLPPDSTLLLMPAAERDAGLAVRECPDPEALPDWTGRFRQVPEEEKENKKVYALHLAPGEAAGARFRLTAEEMCELYADGRFLGVSFWNPHVFDAECLDSAQAHELKLVVTGNASGLYTPYKVPFGLGVDNGDGSALL